MIKKRVVVSVVVNLHYLSLSIACQFTFPQLNTYIDCFRLYRFWTQCSCCIKVCFYDLCVCWFLFLHYTKRTKARRKANNALNNNMYWKVYIFTYICVSPIDHLLYWNLRNIKAIDFVDSVFVQFFILSLLTTTNTNTKTIASF